MNYNFPVFTKMPFDNCCGCEACANACPKQIISFKEDSIGFRYPSFEESKCIKCNMCVKVCPQLKPVEKNIELRECLAGYSKDEKIVEASSSGGVFTHIVDWFKTQHPNGKFAGVVWSDDFKYTEFVLTECKENLSKIRVAKYIQARKNGVYQNIKKELAAGVPILFAGCPCEVNALFSCIGKIPDNLYTVDFVCKGATSEKVMREYLSIIAKKKKVTSINLRVVGGESWIPQWVRITFENHKTLFMSFYATVLGKAFHLLQREACYKCTHCGNHRHSDLTLGDFHGADSARKYYNALGTSIIVVNTSKGKEISNALKTNCVLENVSYEEISRENPRVERAWEKKPGRDLFAKYLAKHGLLAAYLRVSPKKHGLKTFFKWLFHRYI